MTGNRRIPALAVPRLALAAMVALAFVAVAAGTLLLNQGQANAASASVAVGSPNNRFTPNVSNIAVGDTVTFTWSAGTHVVDLKDVSPDIAIDSAHPSGTTSPFSKAGTYYYYCSIHATEDQATEAHVQAGDAMVGKIVVSAAAAPASTPAPGSTSQNTPSPGAPGTGNGAPYSVTGNDTLAFVLLAGAGVLFVLATAGVVVGARRR